MAHVAIEDELIERRESRIGLLGRANGLVVNEEDGSPSSIIRMGTREALEIGLKAYAQAQAQGEQLAKLFDDERLYRAKPEHAFSDAKVGDRVAVPVWSDGTVIGHLVGTVKSVEHQVTSLDPYAVVTLAGGLEAGYFPYSLAVPPEA